MWLESQVRVAERLLDEALEDEGDSALAAYLDAQREKKAAYMRAYRAKRKDSAKGEQGSS